MHKRATLSIHPGVDQDEPAADTNLVEEPDPEPVPDPELTPIIEVASVPVVEEEPPAVAAERPEPLLPQATDAEAAPRPSGPRKAGAQIEVCAGIMERTLPDGRIAFRAAKDDYIGRDALTALCKGKAVWNPMFANWVCPPEIAIEIRTGLPAMFGACDIADGWLSWRTSIDRGWRKLRHGKAVRAIGLARAAFGVAGVTVAVVGTVRNFVREAD